MMRALQVTAGALFVLGLGIGIGWLVVTVMGCL